MAARVKRHAGAAVLALLAGAAGAGPVSLGFEGYGAGAAPPEMAEDGFRLVTRNLVISGPGKSGDGTDGPHEIEGGMGAPGALAILRDAPFTFVSLDWQAEAGTPVIRAEGYLGAHLVAREQFTSSEAGYVTFEAGALAGQVIDRLILYPQRDGAGMGALDRVILDTAPEGPGMS
ncbi:hypothetical protein ACSSV8_002706 [Roseovarius sp. MBR-79]